MSKEINLGEANRRIKDEQVIFEKFAKVFSKISESEEKATKTRKEYFEIFNSMETITEKDNPSLNKLYKLFGKTMLALEEDRQKYMNSIKNIIVPITENYPLELKKNKNNLEELEKARRTTQNLQKSQVGQSEIDKSQREEKRKTDIFEDKFLEYEKQRVMDNKYLLNYFIHSELKFHCAAIQKLGELFSHINKSIINLDLEKFAEEYGIKDYDFSQLSINMEQLNEQKEKLEKEEKQKKDDVFEKSYDEPKKGKSINNLNNSKDDEKSENDEDDNDNTFGESKLKSRYTNKGKNSILSTKKSKNTKMSRLTDSQNVNDDL